MGRNDPGSKSAINKGCTCPVIDNHHGKGIPMSDGSPYFWINDTCPIHKNYYNGSQEDDPEEELLDKYLLPPRV